MCLSFFSPLVPTLQQKVHRYILSIIKSSFFIAILETYTEAKGWLKGLALHLAVGQRSVAASLQAFMWRVLWIPTVL